jgi:hypothetical protein
MGNLFGAWIVFLTGVVLSLVVFRKEMLAAKKQGSDSHKNSKISSVSSSSAGKIKMKIGIASIVGTLIGHRDGQ